MNIASRQRRERLAEIKRLAATVPGPSTNAQAKEIVARHGSNPAVQHRSAEAVRLDLVAILRGALK